MSGGKGRAALSGTAPGVDVEATEWIGNARRCPWGQGVPRRELRRVNGNAQVVLVVSTATVPSVAAPCVAELPIGPRSSTRRARALDRCPCDRRLRPGRAEAL